MTISSDQLCQECREVENLLGIDINRLLKDLAIYKGGNELTEQEKSYICLSFLGNEPIDIARKENSQLFYTQLSSKNPSLTKEEIHKLVEQKLRDRARHISNYLSKTVNQYILGLIETDNSKSDKKPRPSWLKILCFLKNNGYKKVAAFSQQPSSIKRIVIEYQDEIDSQKIVEFLKWFDQKFGQGSLNIEEIESEGDEDNE